MSYGMYRSDKNAAHDEKLTRSVRVSILARVEAFDPGTMTVNVQPLVKTNIDGKFESQPMLVGIPVGTLCMGDFVIRPWYKRGDVGIVIIGDSDMDLALESGEEAEPNTTRSHAPEDGVFYGGIGTKGKIPKGLPDNALVLAADGTYLAVTPGGIEIKGTLTVDGIVMNTHTHTAPNGVTSGPR